MGFELKGKNVLITGGSRGLGAVIARKFAREGSNVIVNYVNKEAPALELAKGLVAKYGVKADVVQGDCGVLADCYKCVRETIRVLGGIDVIIGNAGWTRFSKFDDLDAMSEEEWDKCWATNVKGQHALLKEAMPTFRENAEGGVFIVTSSIAGVTITGSSMPYSITKCAQLHLVKCLAKTQGDKVRVNAVLPGLLLTEWGNQFGEKRINDLKQAAVLKRDTDLEDCADAYIMLAKNTSMTGQYVQVDAGLAIQHL